MGRPNGKGARRVFSKKEVVRAALLQGRCADLFTRCTGNPTWVRETTTMKHRKVSKKIPSVRSSEVQSLPKSEAVLLRLTVQDKKTIVAAASKLHLTVTEFVTRASLIVAEKV